MPSAGIEQLVRNEVNNHLLRMSSEIPEIIDDLTSESKLSLRPWKTKASAEAFAKESPSSPPPKPSQGSRPGRKRS